MSKTVVTKIQLRYDSLENWLKTDAAGKGGNYVPLSGEVCVVSIPSGSTTDQNRMDPPQVMMKVGDGKTAFSKLPWLSANAADVYSWAKLSLDEFKAQVLSDYQEKLTDEQVLAINSGITATKVATYDEYANDIAKGVTAYTNLNNHTVKSDVPENAVFTDTTYTLTGENDKVMLTPEGGEMQSIKVNNVEHATAADTADKLKTARKIAISGDASGSVSFDGSGDVDIKIDVAKAAALDSVSVGGATVPVYFNAEGKPEAITSYSGNAATATKAEQDGNGNVIASTYVKKAGDTMTGVLTMNAGFESTAKSGNYLANLVNSDGSVVLNLENGDTVARISANPSTEDANSVLIKSVGAGYDIDLRNATGDGSVNGSLKVSNGTESASISEEGISLSSSGASVTIEDNHLGLMGKEKVSITAGGTTAYMPLDKSDSETIAMVSDITAKNVGLDKVVNAGQDSTPTADSGNYVTSGGVKSYVDNAVSTMAKFQYKVVDALPTASKDTLGIIYLVSHSHSAGDGYDEYITLQSGDAYSWEKIGNTDIDLSEYTKTADYKALSFGVVDGDIDAYDPITAKTVKLKGAEGTKVTFDKATGVFTISSSIYGLKAASSTDLGGVKLIDDTRLKDTVNDRKAVAGKTYAVQLDGDDKMVVNVPWNYREVKTGVVDGDSETVLASDSTLPLTIRAANQKHVSVTGKSAAGDIILDTGDDVLLATDVLVLTGGSSSTNVD